VSTARIAFIAHGYCPACRHELTGLPYADPLTCPECGEATEPGELPLVVPPGPLARFLNIPAEPGRRVACVIGLALFALVTAPLWLSALMPRCGCARPMTAATRLRYLHQAHQVYAADNGWQYPAHATALVIANYYTPEMLVDSRTVSDASFKVGDVDLRLYDWSPEATAELEAAIASSDLSAAYYRLGDFWLTRLPGPTGSRALVAGWCDVVSDGERWIIFDDDQLGLVDRDDWPDLWNDDAEERARLGLPLIWAPPWSDDDD
jgi:hypothetical protein